MQTYRCIAHICLFILVSLLNPSNLHSQSTESDIYALPRPIIGWDSLSRMIDYPLITHRAGLQAGYLVKIQLDSLGIINQIRIQDLSFAQELVDTNFLTVSALLRVIRNVTWLPAIRRGKKVNYSITIPVIFLLKPDLQQVDPIIKIAPPDTMGLQSD